MIRPEEFAVERERPRCEWNLREVLYLRRFFPNIEASDAPFFGLVRNIFVLSPR